MAGRIAVRLLNRKPRIGPSFVALVAIPLVLAWAEPVGLHPGAAIFTSPARKTSGVGAVSGQVRVTSRQAAGLGGARSTLGVIAQRDGDSAQFTWGTFLPDSSSTATFSFPRLSAGTWQLTFTERHTWSVVFPAMRLSRDSTVRVKVGDKSSVVLPQVVLQPVAPFIVVATSICPWPFPGPFTPDDWGQCDSGYWGGLDVEVVVSGVAGTATAGVQRTFLIKHNEWFAEVRELPAGEYDVTGTAKQRSVGPSLPCNTGWKLVPWHTATKRLRIDSGMWYTGFEFWCQS